MCPMNEYYVNDNFVTRKKPLWFADENEDKKNKRKKNVFYTNKQHIQCI